MALALNNLQRVDMPLNKETKPNQSLLCAKWVLRLLTVDQKQQHIDNSEHCLQLFQRNKKEFLCKYLTMDETGIHHFTLESNQ